MPFNENTYIGTSVKVYSHALCEELCWIGRFCTGGKSGHIHMTVEEVLDSKGELSNSEFVLHFCSPQNANRSASTELLWSVDPTLFMNIKKFMKTYDSNMFHVYLEWEPLSSGNKSLDSYHIIFYAALGKDYQHLEYKKYNRLLNRDIYLLEKLEKKDTKIDILAIEEIVHAILTAAKMLIGSKDHGRLVMFKRTLAATVGKFLVDYRIPVAYPNQKEESCQDEPQMIP